MEYLAVLLVVVVFAGVVMGIPAPLAEWRKSHVMTKRDACTATSSLTSEQKQILLDAHNDARDIASPTPYTPLAHLTWDEGLASRAQELADSCRYAHDVMDDCAGMPMGQNIAWYGSIHSTIDNDIAGYVIRWDSEKADYDLANDSCSDMCGHYTQLVWDDTTSVGCGYKNCPKLYNLDGSLRKDMENGSAWFLVCDYSPPGNSRGETPYDTEYVEIVELVDNMGAKCTDWVYTYCNHPTKGYWANRECALTCSQM